MGYGLNYISMDISFVVGGLFSSVVILNLIRDAGIFLIV